MYERVLYCHHIYYKEHDSNSNINVSYCNKLYMHIFEHLRHCSSDSLVFLCIDKGLLRYAMTLTLA
jgi:hypothetical protein